MSESSPTWTEGSAQVIGGHWGPADLPVSKTPALPLEQQRNSCAHGWSPHHNLNTRIGTSNSATAQAVSSSSSPIHGST
jgi:hypothetical protein